MKNVYVKKISGVLHRYFFFVRGTILIDNTCNVNTSIEILATTLKKLKRTIQVTKISNNKILFVTSPSHWYQHASCLVTHGKFKFTKSEKGILIFYIFSLKRMFKISYLPCISFGFIGILLFSNKSELSKWIVTYIIFSFLSFSFFSVMISSTIHSFLKKVYTQSSKRDKLIF